MHFSKFSIFPDLYYGISERRDGNMRLGAEGQIDQKILENRRIFFESKSIDPNDVVTAGLVHSNRVVSVFKKDRGKIIPQTDGLATSESKVFVSITIADCVPIYFYDSIKQVVCIVHAGLKGILSGIVKNSIELLQGEFQTSANNLLVGLGPSIKKRNYDISKYDKSLVKGYEDFVSLEQGKKLIDLQAIIKAQLTVLGVKSDNIETDPACTFEEKETYFSHRRDQVDPLEAMVSYIGKK